ncbi:ribulose-phosphate 3-epimerase [Spirochaetia bacterium]|nr:ribulose-phosphate 3-epimerase [Spirochaetia bacterium]GHU33050.1 ribulose-phosphate 3-epimerase [Spirochaetia bacterium]
MIKKTIVAPSLLSADFSHFADSVAEIEDSGAEWVHFDSMDGHFVPDLTFGPKVVRDLRPQSKAIFDVHLMVERPDTLIDAFIESGADNITFHLESAVHIHRILESVRHAGKGAGISIVPSTPVSFLSELLPFVDLILIMTVDPGYGGQVFIPESIHKIRSVKKMREESTFPFLIAVDGGINESNAALVRDAGADVLITGSAFFKSADKRALVKSLKGE